jgi:Fe-only nitrogenase accessory protein AnfO
MKLMEKEKHMKIAIFVDKKGNSLSFYETGTVELYGNESGAWDCLKRIPFGTDENMGLGEIRSRIIDMVKELDGCNVFIAKTIKGVPFTILEGLGINIWKIDGSPREILDTVMQEEEKIRIAGLKPKPEPLPVGDIRDGNFKIDLVKVLDSDNTLTSKQVLVPFMQKTAFQRLEIICEHVPGWFEREFGALKLKYSTEKTDGGLCKATVYPED